MRTNQSSRRAVASFLCLSTAALAAPVMALTLGVGETQFITADTNLGGPLVMEGGTLRIGDGATGRALTLQTSNASLASGYINHHYAQLGGTHIDFSGTTSVPGAPVGAFPADGMTIRASVFDTRGLTLFNRGQFVQSGTGQLTLLGDVRFVNTSGSSYFIDNDLGFQRLGSPATSASFVNEGGSIFKRQGSGLANFNLPVTGQHGKVEVWNGSLALNAGGQFLSTTFYADAFGNGHSEIQFGGSHVLSGLTLSETGVVRVLAGSEVRLSNYSESGIPKISVWNQKASLQVNGNLDIDSAVLINTGTLQTVLGGAVSGRWAGGSGTLFNSGSFNGNVRAGRDVHGSIIDTETFAVVNDGQFQIDAGQVVEVRGLTNHGGVLTVDGELGNYGGEVLRLYGGELRGSGVINGDVFVGGGPGVASFKPGHSPGTMTINGNFSLLPGSVLELEVESGPAGPVFDRLAVSGDVFLDGQVHLLVGQGLTAADLAGVNFFDCNGCSISYGTNFNWDFPSRPGSTLSFDASGLHVVTLAPVPEPSSAAMLLLGLLVFARVRRTGAGTKPGPRCCE
jgi:hypothetical protein